MFLCYRVFVTWSKVLLVLVYVKLVVGDCQVVATIYRVVAMVLLCGCVGIQGAY